jgi:hypothetical protein
MDLGNMRSWKDIAFAGIRFGRLFRVVSWDLEYGVEDVSPYGMV